MVETSARAEPAVAPDPVPPVRRSTRVSPALDDAAKLAVIGLFILGLIVALRAAAEILVPLAAAVTVGFVLNPAAAKLERRGVPGFAVAGIFMVAIALGIYVLTYLFSAPLQQWVQRLPALVSALYGEAMHLRASLLHVPPDPGAAQGGPKQILDLISSTGILSSAALTAPSILGEFALFAVALLFLIALRVRIRAGLLAMCIRRRTKLMTAHILRDIERRVSAYLATVTLINIGVGVVTTCVMWLLGLPSPALWGALATLMNFAPYIGPAVMVTVMAAVGLTTFHTFGAAVAPPAAMALIFFTEGNFITPSILGVRFTLNPLLVLVSLSFWLWLWGPIGAILAVPLLILGIVVFTYTALPHIAAREIEEHKRVSRARRRPIVPIEPPPRSTGTVEVSAPPHL
ncbi:MAG TPA: AI-2E family transporter [Hyphomicrobiales bacterium]|nr:AI-2E family transporter [Hyphomicrobiales bacterium]